jgi:DegV family protein with EDD domain
MESKIKILTDSASDIPKEYEEKYNIGILCFPVVLGDRSFRERDISNKEFYEMLLASKDFPSHSQVTSFEFVEAYKQYYDEGYTDIIYVSIASKGSNTYNASLMARDSFYEEYPEAKQKINIHIVDSGNYSGVYGYPVIQAAIKASKGSEVPDILAYLDDWFSHIEVHFGCYTLEYVKRSGRVSTAAAFVGEMLGLRPVIKICDGVSSTDAKVRGDKAIIPKLLEITKENIIPQTPYVLLTSYLEEQAKELEKEAEKLLGYPPEMSFPVGATVSSNAGPKLVGIAFKSKNRK